MASTLLSHSVLQRLLCCLLWLFSATAFAASDWKAAAGVNLSERYTDNVDLTANGGQSAFISEVTPTVSLSRQGKRGSANLTYSLTDRLYDSGKNDLTQSLNAAMQVEPVTGVMKLAGNAQISQQYASQFAPASQDVYQTNGNRVETRSVSLTPSLHNELFDRGLITDTSLGLSYASAGGNTLGTSFGNNLAFSAKNGPRPGPWAYSASASRNSSDSNGAPTTVILNDSYHVGYAVYKRTQIFFDGGYNGSQGASTLQGQGGSYAVAGVNWIPANYFTLTATAGRSSGSKTYGLSGTWKPNPKFGLAATLGKRDNANSYSLSGNWTPSVLTAFSASAQKNFDSGTFGVDTISNGLSSYGMTSYALNLNHRVRRAVVGLNYTESVVNAAQQFNQMVAFPYYLCDTNLGVGVPNYVFQPVVPGQPMPNGCTPVSVLAPISQVLNQTTYNKTWAGTLNFELGRSSLAFTLSQTHRLYLSTTNQTDQDSSFSANWALPLSGRTSTSVGTTWSTAQAATQNSDTYALYWTLAHQISPHVSSNFSARHSEQRTNVASTGNIRENSVSAQLGMTF